MTQPARFTQSDVARAVKGFIAGGVPVGKAVITPLGNIEVYAASGERQTNGKNSWDEVLENNGQ